MRAPRLWRLALEIALPRRARECVIPDLEEEFQRLAALDPAAARHWYRREVVRGIAPALDMRFRRRAAQGPRPALGGNTRRGGSRRRRSRRRSPRFDAVAQDLRLATRNLASRPSYLAIATLTLAIGIGGSTLVFSIVDAVAFRELPYQDADRLTLLWERSLADPNLMRFPPTVANYLDWEEMTESYQNLAAYNYASPIFSGSEAAERVPGILVSGDLFETLGVSAAAGRVIDANDVDSGAEVAVISHEFWVRGFGQAENTLGSQVDFNGTPTTIIGIMPPGFRFPFLERRDVWRPLRFDAEQVNDRNTPELFVVGRLRDDVSLQQARAEGDAIAAALAERYPEANSDRGMNIITQRDEWLEGWASMLRAFSMAVGLGLGIACLNLAGLMLSRGLTRTHEISTRLALGASTARITSLVLAEATVIAGAGAALGAAFAFGALPLFIRVLPFDEYGGPVFHDAQIDARSLAVGTALAFGTALLAGLLPVVQARRSQLAGALSGGGRSTQGRSQIHLRRAMVVAQTTLALVLLGQAAVLGRSVVNVYSYDLGFAPEGVLHARVRANPDSDNPDAFYASLRRDAAALPGVTGVSLTSSAPMSGGGQLVSVTTDGSEPSAVMNADTYNEEVQIRFVDANYFDLLEVPLVSGRGFAAGDVRGAERVAVVNERFADIFFAGGGVRGATVRTSLMFERSPEGFAAPRRVVGVVGDIAVWGPHNPQPPIIYVPHPQEAAPAATSILLKTDVPPLSLGEPLKESIWRLGNRMPVEQVDTLMSMRNDFYIMSDFLFAMMGAFAGGALLLASVGLYGITAFQVRARMREICIRVALGARSGQVLRGVLGEGVALAALGTLLGAGIIAATGPRLAGHFISRFVFEASWFDVASIGTASLCLIAAAVVACIGPARKAAGVDPATALQAE